MKIAKEDQLIQRYWRKNLGRDMTIQEQEQWRLWKLEQESNDGWEKLLEAFKRYHQYEREKEKALLRLEAAFEERFGRPMRQAEEPKVSAMKWPAWSRVAAVVVLCAMGGWFLWQKKPVEQQVTRLQPLNRIALPADSIILVLANEARLAIKQAAEDRIIVRDQHVTISIHEGRLVYSIDSGRKAMAALYHTILVPPGRQLQLTLPDSSLVSLSAATRFRFPLNMKTEARDVDLTGEGFFKVSRSPKPFRVTADAVQTQALGTHFGIDSRPEEGYQDITLFTGEIQITSGIKRLPVRSRKIIRVRGDKMSVYSSEARQINAVASREKGVFSYEEASLSTIVTDLARWYGLSIVNPEKLASPYHFNLEEMKRSEPVKKVLKVLESSQVVKFGLKGNALTITHLKM